MKKGFYAVPALLFLGADIMLAAGVWKGEWLTPAVYLVIRIALAAALLTCGLKAGKSEKDSGDPRLPGYWRTYLAGRLSDIQKRDMEIGNHGDSFIFITDLHYNANDGKSAAAAEYIMAGSSVGKVVIGGDICNGSSRGKAVCVEQILKCRNAFRRLQPYYVRGNHDNNTEISERSDDKTISDSELYGMILKPVEDRMIGCGNMHYYFHNETQKIRYICLDTGHPDPYVIDDAQIVWMQDRIRELETGWTAVILTHQYYSAAGEMDGNGEKILAGLNAVCDEAKAVIACVICGHSHADCLEMTEKGFPVICTTCDARGGEAGTLKRRYHTHTEQAFDVFHIDTAARKIHITRIGAGTDRQASYGLQE